MALDDNGGAAATTTTTASAADMLGGAAAAGAPAGAAAGAAAATAAATEPLGEAAYNAWLGEFAGESEGDTPSLRDWVKSTDVKDLNSLAKVARDNQRALRESGRIKVPGEGAPPEEVTTFRKAIGVPDDATGYKMPVVNGADGKPVELKADKLTAIAKLAHENGIPGKALEATLQGIAEADALELATAEQELTTRAQAHVDTWGAQKDNNLAAMGRAFEALGLERDEVLKVRAALGPERAMDVFTKLGRGISEDIMLAGDRRTFAVSGAQAQAEINRKRQDPKWTSSAMTKGTPENAEYNRLLEAAGAAADRLESAG